MVVVGGRSSANTKELTRLVGIAGKPAIQIEGGSRPDRPGRVRRARGRRRSPAARRPRSRTSATSPGACSRSPARPTSPPTPTSSPDEALAGAATPAGRTTLAPDVHPRGAARPPAPRRVRPCPSRARRPCPSSPSSAARTSASRTLFNRFVGSARRSSRTGPGRRATGCTATRSGTAGGSSSSTPAASRSTPADPIELKVQEQARLAIGEADVILFLVDAVSGLTPADQEAAELLRTADEAGHRRREQGRQHRPARPTRPSSGRSAGRRPTRSPRRTAGAPATCSTRSSGRSRPRSGPEIARKTREEEADDVGPRRRRRPARAVRRRRRGGGRGRRRQRAEDETDASPPAGTPRSPPRRRTTSPPRSPSSAARTSASRRSSTPSSGRTGRSSSEVPGTTRDAIDTTLEWGRSEVVLIDTAGIKRRGKVAGGPAAERYSTLRSLKAIGRADVAVLVIDAVEGLTAQDAHVAGYVVEEGRGLVVAVNKWDLVEDKTDRTFDQYVEWIRSEVAVPRLRPGRLDQREDRAARRQACSSSRSTSGASAASAIATGRAEPGPPARASERQQPPVVKGRRPKIFYGTQAARRAADVRVLRERRGLDPLQLPALPREPAPRRVRLPRDADQARLPGPRVGRAAAAALAARIEDARAKTSAGEVQARRASTGGRSKSR